MHLKKCTIPLLRVTLILAVGLVFSKCTSDDCPVDEVKWAQIKEDNGAGANLDFQVELNAAVEKDLEDLRAKGEEKVNYQVDGVWKKYSQRTAEVSKEFYEAFLAKRGEICALHSSLQKDEFKDLSSRMEAETQYLTALKELGKMGRAPEKTTSQKADELRQQYASTQPVLENKISQLSGQSAITGKGYLEIYEDQLNYLETDIKRFGANELTEDEFEVNLGMLEKKLMEYANLIQSL